MRNNPRVSINKTANDTDNKIEEYYSSCYHRIHTITNV